MLQKDPQGFPSGQHRWRSSRLVRGASPALARWHLLGRREKTRENASQRFRGSALWRAGRAPRRAV